MTENVLPQPQTIKIPPHPFRIMPIALGGTLEMWQAKYTGCCQVTLTVRISYLLCLEMPNCCFIDSQPQNEFGRRFRSTKEGLTFAISPSEAHLRSETCLKYVLCQPLNQKIKGTLEIMIICYKQSSRG